MSGELEMACANGWRIVLGAIAAIIMGIAVAFGVGGCSTGGECPNCYRGNAAVMER